MDPAAYSTASQPLFSSILGTVEDWKIENRAFEEHEFHIHQIHFLNYLVNGQAVMPDMMTMQDTVRVPQWDGSSPSYPSVTLRMDFRDAPIAGDGMFHCHILEHEDLGMMGQFTVS